MYSKTHWQDRVVDPETGEVVQEGTFMSAENFNKMEEGIAANSADLISHSSDSVKHITSTERTNWNAAKSKADTNEANISTLVKHINGDLLDSDFAEDSTVAMTKTVPSGMSNYAAVKMIGGYTRKTVNLFDINSAPYITKVDDETFNMVHHTNVVMSGFKANTQYTFSGYAKNNVSGGNIRFRIEYTDGSATDIMKVDGSEYKYREVTSQAGKSISHLIGYYGMSGNATFKQFQVQEGTAATPYEPYGELWNAPVESAISIYGKNFFPKKSVNLSYSSEIATGLHIPAGDYVFSAIGSSTISINVIFNYIDGTSKMVLLGIESAKRTAVAVSLTSTVVSIGSYVNGSIKINDVQLEKGKAMTAYEPYHETTLSIPEAIKNLPDYGCAVSDTLYNWVDFENGVYHHVVGSIDLGDCAYTYYSATSVFFTDNVTKKANGLYNLICGSLDTAGSGDKIIYGNTDSVRIHIKDTTKGTTDATTFKEAMKGIILVYKLATEELIDISDILHPIRVETGGTITLQNEHNLDMPNSIMYKKEISLS